jgi:hypothetical protein
MGRGPRTSSVDSTAALREGQYVSVSSKSKRTLAKWQLFNILRRLAAIAAAVQYAYVSFSATWWALNVLSGAPNPIETLRVFPSSLIQGYLGSGLIRDSPLVHDILGGDTTPRKFALFLESETKTSTDKCSQVPLFNPAIYNYSFLSSGFQTIARDSEYHIGALAGLELVVTVVDCSFRQIVVGDPSAVRVFNLVRSREDPSDLRMLTMSLNVQQYEVRSLKKRGPALVGMITLVNDMQAPSVDQFYVVATTYPYLRSASFEMYEPIGITSESYLELRSIPRDPVTEPVKHLLTAMKRGLFNGDGQVNVRTMYSSLDGLNATSALTRWEWTGESVIVDSWAWVHCIHFFFGLQTIYALIVLFLVMYHKFHSGKVWIGDPFASVSTANLVMRGVLVILSCFLDSFWSVNEYAMSRASMLTGSQTVLVHKEIMHADIMVVFMSLVGFISAFFRERIDPSVAIFLFEIIHKFRLTLMGTAPAVVDKLMTYSDTQWNIGIAQVTPGIAAMSPMRLWSSFQFPSKDPVFIIASFFPTTYLLVAISCLAIVRKIYRYCYPDKTQQRSSQSTDTSNNEKAAMSQRGVVTNFELSTGAELQTRFGLISDYNNYVFFKGMKFASADGVYCSGYVIVNGKFLVSIKNLLAIVMIKLFRLRFIRAYVYEVDGNTVKETARLVCPETFLWSDLWRLSVTVLL